MNQILTDEEITLIVRECARGSSINRDGSTSHRIARAIEAAVINKLNSAEPVAWQERQQTKTGLTNWYDSGKPPSRDRKLSEVIGGIEYQWRPLFTHPPAPSAVEWVSVEDRLPGEQGHDSEEVLCFINGHCGLTDFECRNGGAWGIRLGYYDAERGGFRVHGRLEGQVTHWLPLPQPPVAAARSEE